MGIVMQEKEGCCRGHHWREKNELFKLLENSDKFAGGLITGSVVCSEVHLALVKR